VRVVAAPGGARGDPQPRGRAPGPQAPLRVTVNLDIYGLAPAGAVALRLRPGSCLALGAAPLATFPAVTADATGVVRTGVVSDQAQPAGIPHHAVVDVELPDGGATPSLLACTDIPAGDATAPLRLFAPPALKPAGTATLTYDARAARLDMRIFAIGLPARATVAAEIHRGTCTAQGAPLGGLGGIAADSRGMVDSAGVVAHLVAPRGHWYVAVRSQVSTGAAQPGPLLCGDVVGLNG
jgi:hypothetical protein